MDENLSSLLIRPFWSSKLKGLPISALSVWTIWTVTKNLQMLIRSCFLEMPSVEAFSGLLININLSRKSIRTLDCYTISPQVAFTNVRKLSIISSLIQNLLKLSITFYGSLRGKSLDHSFKSSMNVNVSRFWSKGFPAPIPGVWQFPSPC